VEGDWKSPRLFLARNEKDDIPHGIAATNNAFKKSQALDTDDSYAFTFTTPGTYQYFCYLHPHMVGSIVVEATTGSNAAQ
jgi:plastocyanin